MFCILIRFSILNHIEIQLCFFSLILFCLIIKLLKLIFSFEINFAFATYFLFENISGIFLEYFHLIFENNLFQTSVALPFQCTTFFNGVDFL